MPATPLTAEDLALGFDAIERLKWEEHDDGTVSRRIAVVAAGTPLACPAHMGMEEIRLRGTVKVGDMQYADLVTIHVP